MHSNTLVALTAAMAVAAAADAGYNYPSGSSASIKNLRDKIKTVVIMVMENRSFDNIMGGQRIPGLENPIQTGPYCNPVNLSSPAKGYGCTQALDYDSIIDDPDHSISGNNLEFFGSFAPDNKAIASGKLQPNMKGFLTEQIRLYSGKESEQVLQTQVINYYTEQQVPVITSLSRNFMVFNHWHSDIPGVRISSIDSFTSVVLTYNSPQIPTALLCALAPRQERVKTTLATTPWSKSPSSNRPVNWA
jgi:phospholipase C